jgi:predicted nucleic acid-binding Zn ribbon protein
MTNEINQLGNIAKWRRARRPDRTVGLGQAAQQFMTEQVSPRQARFGAVLEIWSGLLPAELARHCEIVDVSGGQLKVKVDSPAYKYELQLCSSELLRELQQQCPKARLTKIKFVVA